MLIVMFMLIGTDGIPEDGTVDVYPQSGFGICQKKADRVNETPMYGTNVVVFAYCEGEV